ncbi:hypothetical protein PILCRDRAFT_822702 [Piloderma croceum F 1598]|uniref:Uncharacterized protein n=1 Tax=Piloderma croceum (strain F 1598) TaxID=765440 RepID=A0A0C3FKZ6_PILCF|nr:hypothetical protein PILCRDRAFT_822702 [Piloderma croceum F 1598]
MGYKSSIMKSDTYIHTVPVIGLIVHMRQTLPLPSESPVHLHLGDREDDINKVTM